MNIEHRHFNGNSVELRGSDKSRKIVGYALKFNSLSKDLGGFQERIDPSALTGADLSDVVALFNHDKNKLLARTSSATLKLNIDNVGLRYEFDSPETTTGNDLLVSVKRGDVNGSSFSFIIAKNGDTVERKNGIVIRTITKFERIIDVSPVVFPAYNETEVGKRGLTSLSEVEYTKMLMRAYK